MHTLSEAVYGGVDGGSSLASCRRLYVALCLLHEELLARLQSLYENEHPEGVVHFSKVLLFGNQLFNALAEGLRRTTHDFFQLGVCSLVDTDSTEAESDQEYAKRYRETKEDLLLLVGSDQPDQHKSGDDARRCKDVKDDSEPFLFGGDALCSQDVFIDLGVEGPDHLKSSVELWMLRKKAGKVFLDLDHLSS